MTIPTESLQADAQRAAFTLARIHDELTTLLSPRLAAHLGEGGASALLAAQGRVRAELAAIEAKRAAWRREAVGQRPEQWTGPR